MGGKNGKEMNNSNEQLLIFDLLKEMRWNDRVWKIFCFRFEYRFFHTYNKFQYLISWEEFENILLEGFSNRNTDHNQFLIYYTLKKYFQLHNNQIRIYRIYMLFFTLVYHLPDMECLNFLDLFHEKIIYNLEIEMRDQGSGKEYRASTVESEKDEPPDESKMSDIHSIKNRNFVNTSRQPITNRQNENELLLHLPSQKRTGMKIENKPEEIFSLTQTDNLLLIYYSKFYSDKMNNSENKIIKKIPIKIFREIIYIFFQNNITFILKAYKSVLDEFEENKFEDDNLVNKIKSIKYKQGYINLDLLTTEKVYEFVDIALNKLINNRINLSMIKEKHDVLLTYDDIFTFMKLNSFFFLSSKSYSYYKTVCG
jgi:hypothetical protein